MIKALIKNFKQLIQFKNYHYINNLLIGKNGEKIAVNFLKCEKKYKIIACNWTYKKDEIDIIAKDGEVLVFVEVRTRSAEEPTAYYSVTAKKKEKLRRGCKAFLKYTKPAPRYFRFDIITVKFCKGEENVVRHYSNVKLFSKNFHALGYE